MKDSNDNKNPAAVALGKLGGAAGTGKAKSRGNKAYYRKLAFRRVRIQSEMREAALKELGK
jgi:hypothetical protein